jgi:hypothetical protein
MRRYSRCARRGQCGFHYVYEPMRQIGGDLLFVFPPSHQHQNDGVGAEPRRPRRHRPRHRGRGSQSTASSASLSVCSSTIRRPPGKA